MPWQRMLHLKDRMTDLAPLEENFSTLLRRVGAVSPLELAALGGRLAATPGEAFIAGYQAALRALWPSAPASLGALCATEARSLRAAELLTRLNGLTLNGQKDFVTAGEAADWLLVAARCEEPGESPRLSLCVVYNGDPGVYCEPLPPMAVMPDIVHGRLRLENAHCERLAGDGWDAYLKPFRSLEDVYVLAALVAWLWGVGEECEWPGRLRLRLLGVLGACADVTRQCPTEPAGHLLLAGVFELFDALEGDVLVALESGPPPWATLWQRDRGILRMSGAARTKRLDKAWAAFA